MLILIKTVRDDPNSCISHGKYLWMPPDIFPPHPHSYPVIPRYRWTYNCLKWVASFGLLRMEINISCYNGVDLRLTVRSARTNPREVLPTIRTPFGHLSLNLLFSIQSDLIPNLSTFTGNKAEDYLLLSRP